MVHRLTAVRSTVDHETISIGVETSLAGNDGTGDQQVAHEVRFRGRDIRQVGYMILGDDQDMCRRLGGDISEGQNPVVFVHLVAGDLAVDELAKKAQEFYLRADRTRRAVYNLCYDYSSGLLADIPLDDPNRSMYKHGIFSQHTNILGILTDIFPEDDVPGVMEKILADTTLIPTTIYYRFYLFQAIQKTGMADRYTAMLGSWE